MLSHRSPLHRYNIRMIRYVFAFVLLCPLAAAGAEWRYGGQVADASDAQSASPAVSSDRVAGDVPEAAPDPAMTMSRVRETVGEPEQILEGVGDPPITRWQYPGYVVYFEHDRVITSVAGRI